MGTDMKKVLFVCTKNMIRSQMAEAIFNHLAKKAVAESAGTDPADKIHPITRSVLEEAGISLAPEASPKDVSNEMMDEADLVVSFGCLVPSLFPKDKFEEWRMSAPKTMDDFRELRKKLVDKIERIIGERGF